MVIELDFSGQRNGGRNRELETRSQKMHQSTDDGDHPSPSSLRIVVTAQQPSRLHLGTAVGLNSCDIVLISGIAGFGRTGFLLQKRVVDESGAAFSACCCVQQRPGSRPEYRHHKREEDSVRGYVPVSLPLVLLVYASVIPVAHIGAACDRDRARAVRNMLLPIVATAA